MKYYTLDPENIRKQIKPVDDAVGIKGDCLKNKANRNMVKGESYRKFDSSYFVQKSTVI
jgi:hypothetical protein